MDVRYLATPAVGWPSNAAVDAPELGGAQMTEDGAFATGQDSRHPSASIRQSPVPHCINTTMKRVEAMGSDAAMSPGLGDAGVAELFHRHDAVLASRKTGN
jgi:hypothetical protein